MLQLVITGNITREPTVINEGTEKQVMFLTVASNHYLGQDNEVATFVELILFGDRWNKRRHQMVKGARCEASGSAYLETTEKDGVKYSKLKCTVHNGQTFFIPGGGSSDGSEERQQTSRSSSNSSGQRSGGRGFGR
jgi:single-stranded DNA-binding protein